jgi:AmmeMemoRadiSam system protein B
MVFAPERSKMRAVSQTRTIRPPAVAGTFYSRKPDQLRVEVQGLLGDAGPSTAVIPKAVIAPHAGYVYSGRVAAAAFATLRGRAQAIERVVLVGPAHYLPMRGIAAPTVDDFETPLGQTPVDAAALAKVADLPFVVRSDAPHAPEHALEVELPFLQMLLPSFRIVPLVVGDAAAQSVAEALRILWGGPETLIVVSSDLSHYHDYETARRLDAATAAAIERGDWVSLRPDQACGYLAVAGLLIEAARRGLTAERLALCNSGDTAGSRDSVVGYGAWIFASGAL